MLGEKSSAAASLPGKDNLIPFRVGAITDYQYLIDGKSLSVRGSDGVLRFALVVISPSGARTSVLKVCVALLLSAGFMRLADQTRPGRRRGAISGSGFRAVATISMSGFTRTIFVQSVLSRS
ncbi:MAG: hypothetical protein IPI21_11800 [Propionivibrio sp.]|nr:hypothetical protein [Propionivibrio sp.]